MALVRILVDGYSLLHTWLALAPGRPRHSAAARAELIHVLTRYQDAVGTPLTLFFDGSGAPQGLPRPDSTASVEVLFSQPGQTADDMIERATHRFQPYGEVLVVTDDHVERETVVGFGGIAAPCLTFIATVEGALAEFATDLTHYNRTEQSRFKQGR